MRISFMCEKVYCMMMGLQTRHVCQEHKQKGGKEPGLLQPIVSKKSGDPGGPSDGPTATQQTTVRVCIVVT